MNEQRRLEHERAETIATLYLLNSGLVKLVPDYSDDYDFLAISKNDSLRQFAVEVKLTKYPKKDLKRIFSKERKKISRLSLPSIFIYIDQHKENGFYEIFKKGQKVTRELQPLDIQELNKQISNLIS